MSTEGRKLYIGNLADGATKEDVEAFFSKFGSIETTWIARNPAGFAFVTYVDTKDAAEAVRGSDGEQLQGRTLRVELAKSSGPRKDRGDRRDDRRGDRRDDRRDDRKDEPRRDDRRGGDRRDDRRDDKKDEPRRDDRRGERRDDSRRERSRSREGRRY